MEELEQQASLAEDSKEDTTSKAEDATPISRKKKRGKKGKKNKKKRKFQRSMSMASESDPNQSKEEDEVRGDSPFGFPEEEEFGEIIAPEAE